MSLKPEDIMIMISSIPDRNICLIVDKDNNVLGTGWDRSIIRYPRHFQPNRLVHAEFAATKFVRSLKNCVVYVSGRSCKSCVIMLLDLGARSFCFGRRLSDIDDVSWNETKELIFNLGGEIEETYE